MLRHKRISNPDIASSDMEQLVSGITAFAFDLYNAVRTLDGNKVYSPYSISLAFAMAYGGANGDTAAQMAETLHYTLPVEQFHPAVNALNLELAGRSAEAAYVEEKDRFQLNIANSLWGQDGWLFLPDYLDLLGKNSGAGLRLVDFKKDPVGARQQINEWVSDQTRSRIKDLIPTGVIDIMTRLVLANAIFFKATWRYEFDANHTEFRRFSLLNGETVNVPMMQIRHSKNLSYAAEDGWQAVALPYRGGLTEMVIMVPDNGNFEAFESGLTAEEYEQILAAMESQDVILSMPKYSFETRYGLKAILAGMGLQAAFDPNAADFSGIDGKRDLFIGDAIHKAFIAVDEKGTEAAAASMALATLGVSRPQGIILTIDRPFFYVIRDVPTGTILFMGRVVDPRSKLEKIKKPPF